MYSENNQPTEKCKLPYIIKPDGANELDPCLYEEIERTRGEE